MDNFFSKIILDKSKLYFCPSTEIIKSILFFFSFSGKNYLIFLLTKKFGKYFFKKSSSHRNQRSLLNYKYKNIFMKNKKKYYTRNKKLSKAKNFEKKNSSQIIKVHM